MLLTRAQGAATFRPVVREALLGCMSDFVEAFRSYLTVERQRSPVTVRRYVAAVEQFAAFLGRDRDTPDVRLEAIRKDELTRFLYARAGNEEPSSAIWNTTLSALRAFYTFLRKRELIQADPTALLDRHRIDPRPRLPLTLAEMVAMVDAAQKHSPPGLATRNAAVLQILFHCGLRLSELTSLDVAQVDLDNHWFADVRVKGGKLLTSTFSDVVAEALERYVPDREQLLAGREHPALFVSTRGGRLCKRAVEDLVKRYARLAGIKRNVFPHIVRHTSGTEYAEVADLHVVKDILGHRDISTTQVYTHSDLAARRAANAKLAKRWRSAAARSHRRV